MNEKHKTEINNFLFKTGLVSSYFLIKFHCTKFKKFKLVILLLKNLMNVGGKIKTRFYHKKLSLISVFPHK